MTRGSGSSPFLPGALPVIDVEAGALRMMGNRPIYLRALARFRSGYRDAGAAIRAALDRGDLALAQRQAHTLKGAAGMIEAVTLYAAAQALEEALRSGERHADTLFARVGELLAQVLRELDGMALPLEDPAPAATPAAPGAQERLRGLLDIGDGAAVEQVATARAELVATLGEREYDALRAAVMEFDYERALDLLDRPGTAGK